MRRPSVIYDFATMHSLLDFLIYEENFVFFFISEACPTQTLYNDIETKEHNVRTLRKRTARKEGIYSLSFAS
jgi:hypothetical protein